MEFARGAPRYQALKSIVPDFATRFPSRRRSSAWGTCLPDELVFRGAAVHRECERRPGGRGMDRDERLPDHPAGPGTQRGPDRLARSGRRPSELRLVRRTSKTTPGIVMSLDEAEVVEPTRPVPSYPWLTTLPFSRRSRRRGDWPRESDPRRAGARGRLPRDARRRLVVTRDPELERKLRHPLDRIRRNPGNRCD